jgi:hypothetical protein
LVFAVKNARQQTFSFGLFGEWSMVNGELTHYVHHSLLFFKDYNQN